MAKRSKRRSVKWRNAPLGPGKQNANVGRCLLIVYNTTSATKPHGWSIRDKHLTKTFATGTAKTESSAKTAAVSRARRVCKR